MLVALPLFSIYRKKSTIFASSNREKKGDAPAWIAIRKTPITLLGPCARNQELVSFKDICKCNMPYMGSWRGKGTSQSSVHSWALDCHWGRFIAPNGVDFEVGILFIFNYNWCSKKPLCCFWCWGCSLLLSSGAAWPWSKCIDKLILLFSLVMFVYRWSQYRSWVGYVTGLDIHINLSVPCIFPRIPPFMICMCASANGS